MFKNMWYFLAVCLLAVKAQSNGDVKSPETLAVNGSETIKVESANISALYIGDLLRTKPKDALEASGSAHQPVVSQQVFLSPSPVAGRTFRYKAHGGHEYIEPEYRQPSPVIGASPIKRAGNTVRGNPVNVMGHLLTLKPVRVVSSGALPAARDSGTPHKSEHYSNDDCSKNGDHSYSSEEKSYVPEQRSYRRAKQIAPAPVPEYRSPQSSYSEDERPVRHYSHSDPSNGRHNSKSHSADSNTKSHSSGSYTKSKSTSTSRTLTPNRSKEKAQIITSTVPHEEDYERNLGPAHGNQGVIVYKVKEPSSPSRPGSYSENSDRDYPPSNYERGHKSGYREQQYEQHSRPVKHSGEVQTYSTTEQQSPKERPRQHAPAHYDSYEQTSYAPEEETQYREQNKPSTNYHPESEYNSQPNVRGQESQKPYYQNYKIQESPVRYEAGQPSKTHSSKRHRSQHYERPSNGGRESNGYRAREPSTPEYTYPQQQQIQSSRSRKERPQSSYESYSSPDIHTESAPVPQSYERNSPTLRPSEEKQMNQYVYEATPHHASDKYNHPKRQHRESSRSARSPGKYVKSVIEEKANFPGRGNEQVALVSRESQPYVSRSESYSESSYNMGENQTPKVKAQEQARGQSIQERQADDRDYQTSYKPYNSEYPASYANDQQHNTAEQHGSQTYEHPYEQPHSPEETPQQYQPYDEEGPYEQDGSHGSDDSYEQGGAPAKKGKNHHYISNIEGYKDTYGSNEPLTIDEEFFRKYGISKNAKVIVASSKDPNLFVADGSNIKEGDYFADSEPINEGSYGPNYKNSFKEDTSSESPEELGMPKEVPGSFDDLVDTNPKFLRNLPKIMKPSSGYFSMDDSEASFDDIEFRDAGEPKGFVVSQGPGEIVQQHGDGVSRILFNIPKDESKSESSNTPKLSYEERNDEKFESSASKVIEKSVKSES